MISAFPITVKMMELVTDTRDNVHVEQDLMGNYVINVPLGMLIIQIVIQIV